jgi:hypothetical protein
VEDWKTLQVVGSNIATNEVDSSFSTILPNITSTKALIQFIHNGDDDGDDDAVSRSSSDNDEPPPLRGKLSWKQDPQPSATTLMQELMAEAALAQTKPTPTSTSKQKPIQNSGMKKGFLLSSKSKKAPKTSHPSPLVSQTTDYHVVASSTRSTGCVGSSLVFPDIHDSLLQSCASPDSTMTTANDNLLERIQDKPHLMKALQDPAFTRALQIIQENPSQAKSIFQQDASMAALLQEFCQLVGTRGTSRTSTTPSQPAPALKACPEQDQVDRLLAEQPLIRQALMDPGMQRIMQECQTHPGRFQAYMTHPKYGPWLRLLMQHGLLQLQR